MNFEKFTDKAQEAVVQAQQLAIKYDHQQVDGEHLHMALIDQEDGLIPKLVQLCGADPGLLKRDLEQLLDKLPRVYGTNVNNVYATRRFNQILIKAEDEAKRFADEYVSVEHIYLVMLQKGHSVEPAASAHGIDREKLLSLPRTRRRKGDKQNPEEGTKRFKIRQTVELGWSGKLDPVIEGSGNTPRYTHSFTPDKNNPVLTANQVGKPR